MIILELQIIMMVLNFIQKTATIMVLVIYFEKKDEKVICIK